MHHTVCDDAHTTVRLQFEDGDTLGLEYLLVPAWYAETFIIDRANAPSWRAQKDRLLEVESLRSIVSSMGSAGIGLVIGRTIP